MYIYIYIYCVCVCVREGSAQILGGVVNFHLKILNLGARRGGDLQLLIVRLCIYGLD